MKLFPAASPAAAIAANRGITVVCLLHLCSFYRECELFFILQFDEFFFRTFYFVYKYYLRVRFFKIYTIFREIENVSLLRKYLLQFDEFFYNYV